MPLINYIGNRQESLGTGAGGFVRGAAPPPPSLSVEYLLVGGGSINYLDRTGGSGGGVVSGSATIAWNTTLGIYVGAGGFATASAFANGVSSSISGSTFGYVYAGGADNDNSGYPQNNSAGLSGPENTAGGGAGSSKDGNSGAEGQNGDGGTGSVWLDGKYYAGGAGGVGDPSLPSNPGFPGLGGGGTAQAGTGPDGLPYQLNGYNGRGGGGAYGGTQGGDGTVIIRYPSSVSRMADGGIQFESGGYYYHEFTTGSGLFRYQYEY